jgi:hypothetical protein
MSMLSVRQRNGDYDWYKPIKVLDSKAESDAYRNQVTGKHPTIRYRSQEDPATGAWTVWQFVETRAGRNQLKPKKKAAQKRPR